METWYVLEDGSPGDPREVAPDAGGVLQHKDGRAVAYAAHGPRSRMVSAEEAARYRTREMRAEPPLSPDDDRPKRAYTTRKARG